MPPLRGELRLGRSRRPRVAGCPKEVSGGEFVAAPPEANDWSFERRQLVSFFTIVPFYLFRLEHMIQSRNPGAEVRFLHFQSFER